MRVNLKGILFISLFFTLGGISASAAVFDSSKAQQPASADTGTTVTTSTTTTPASTSTENSITSTTTASPATVISSADIAVDPNDETVVTSGGVSFYKPKFGTVTSTTNGMTTSTAGSTTSTSTSSFGNFKMGQVSDSSSTASTSSQTT